MILASERLNLRWYLPTGRATYSQVPQGNTRLVLLFLRVSKMPTFICKVNKINPYKGLLDKIEVAFAAGPSLGFGFSFKPGVVHRVFRHGSPTQAEPILYRNGAISPSASSRTQWLARVGGADYREAGKGVLSPSATS